MKDQYQFTIQQSSLNAETHENLPTWMTPEHLLKAYEVMVLIRMFDQKAIALQRTGKMGTYPSILGQEALSTAIGMVMKREDVFVPYYRDQATLYLRGVALKESLLYWGGHERGSQYQAESCAQDMPICVPIATQFCHAAGIASAMKIRGEKRAVVVTGGDGSTSKGDFLESLNLAGAWHLPVVFVVNNNQWAISTPRSIQCGADTLAQKAIGAGIHGVIVDGNDYFSTANEIHLALERALAGKGPTLVETLSYRLSDHTTADDATRYRSSDELKKAWDNEPVKRLQQWLLNNDLWSETQEKALVERSKAEIDSAVNDYLNTTPEPATAMFDHLFAELPMPLQSQYADLVGLTANNGGLHHE